ncbi:hypothetical protein NGRA_1507 [Nosema granulosis]|uniref:Uncharacterized protein n=1 Tax=Nosema granulosis TaxID=83296 RepID=A0A9P6GYV7_9MICR|nr:hypothetical protein NGRA_1507 [Nosema granulosis]
MILASDQRYPTVSISPEMSPTYELKIIKTNEVNSKLEMNLLNKTYSARETIIILPFLKRVNREIGRYCNVFVPVKIIILRNSEGISHLFKFVSFILQIFKEHPRRTNKQIKVDWIVTREKGSLYFKTDRIYLFIIVVDRDAKLYPTLQIYCLIKINLDSFINLYNQEYCNRLKRNKSEAIVVKSIQQYCNRLKRNKSEAIVVKSIQLLILHLKIIGR